MTNQRRVKHVPQRTCVGCREVNAKRQLVRLVRSATGHIDVDPSGKAAGRGAYLHDRRACWVHALERRTLDQALRLTITDADRDRLRAIGDQYSDNDAAT
jgi:predicted RNA-binding protein YlxR (DUF448 family)